jgi:hypothetical protein
MQVTCPNCSEKVSAENINIHKMTAVCAACDTVFPFELTESKAKRRKVKPPDKLILHDSEPLHMEFWTNFRLDRNEAFLSSAIGGVSMTILAFLLFASAGAPPILAVISLLVAFALFYWFALIVVNKTHIEMSEEAIRVTRKPFPNPLNQGYKVSLAGVRAIKYEETAISKKEAYDTPRYRVWAEMLDGSRRTIVNDVIEQYAIFIAQRLEEQLESDSSLDASRLENSEHQMEVEGTIAVEESPNNGRQFRAN